MSPLCARAGAAHPDPRNGGQSHPYGGHQGRLSGATRACWGKRDVCRDDQQDNGSARDQRADRSRS